MFLFIELRINSMWTEGRIFPELEFSKYQFAKPWQKFELLFMYVKSKKEKYATLQKCLWMLDTW